MELVNKLLGSGAAALRDPRELGRAFVMSVGVPVVAFVIFLALWSVAASRIQTSLGAVPGPVQVAEQTVVLVKEHFSEREREAAFPERVGRKSGVETCAESDAEGHREGDRAD